MADAKAKACRATIALRAQPKPRPGRRARRTRGPTRSDQVTARKNLNETAFFFPHLTCGFQRRGADDLHHARGADQVAVPGFAHDRQLRCGFLEGQAVTAKDLMVQPNPPRFLREGDVRRVHRQSLEPVRPPARPARCA